MVGLPFFLRHDGVPMVAPDRFPSAPSSSPDVPAFIRERQKEAAKSAATVGDFARRWKSDVVDVLSPRGAKGEGARSGEDWRRDIEERDRKIQEAARGNENLRLSKLSAETNGEAFVGGGEAGIVLNQDRFAAIGEGDQKPEDIRMTAAHERAHARTVHLRGTLYDEEGVAVPQKLIHEGYGEIGGNEGVGRGAAHVRENQPDEVYGQGQRLLLRIIQKVGRAELERTMSGDGDLRRLQPAFSKN